MKVFFKTVKGVYKLVNNPITKFLFKTLVLFVGFMGKWFFIIFIGPVAWFILKFSFKRAITRTLPKMLKKYFTVTFPKILKKKVLKTYPVNMVVGFLEKFKG